MLRTSSPSSDFWLALLLPGLLLLLLRVLLRSMIIRWPLGTTDDVLGRSREEDMVQWLAMAHMEVLLTIQCQAPTTALWLLAIRSTLRFCLY